MPVRAGGFSSSIHPQNILRGAIKCGECGEPGGTLGCSEEQDSLRATGKAWISAGSGHWGVKHQHTECDLAKEAPLGNRGIPHWGSLQEDFGLEMVPGAESAAPISAAESSPVFPSCGDLFLPEPLGSPAGPGALARPEGPVRRQGQGRR